MKAKIELDKRELKRFVSKKTVTINFPKLEQRVFYIIIAAVLLVSIIGSGLLYQLGENNGSKIGVSVGYKIGEKACLDNDYKELTLTQAIAYNIKYNLNRYFAWIGLVVGLGWVLHGVGFKII